MFGGKCFLFEGKFGHQFELVTLIRTPTPIRTPRVENERRLCFFYSVAGGSKKSWVGAAVESVHFLFQCWCASRSTKTFKMAWQVLLLTAMLHMSAGEDAVVFDWEGSLVPSRLHGQIRYSIDFGTLSEKVLEVGEASLELYEHYQTLQSGEKDAESKTAWLRAVLKKTLLLTKTTKEVMEAIWFSLGIERKGSDFVIRKDYSAKNVRDKRRLRGGRRRGGGVFSLFGEILSDLISPVSMEEEPFLHPGWGISGRKSPFDKEHNAEQADDDAEQADDDAEQADDDVEQADDDVEQADDDVFITVVVEGKHVDGGQAEEPEEPQRVWFAELNSTDFEVLRNSAIHVSKSIEFVLMTINI